MPQRAQPAGPELATDVAALDHMSSERWRRALAAAVDHRWARSRGLLLAVIYMAWAGLCLALCNLGYPAWRVAALTGLLAAMVALHVRHAWVHRSSALERDERIPFVLYLVATALTGGLQSPLLIGVTGHLSGVLIRRGWNREMRAGLAGFFAAALAMAVVPDAWVGPRIPDPAFTITALVVLVFSVAAHTDYLVMMMTTVGEALRQLLHARDARAAEALARAAELERMSSRLSHELKNPLGAIKALVQLSVRAEGDPEIRTRLEVVEGEVERMQSILQGYLSFSRPLETLRPEAVALGPLADEVVSILEARAEGARVRVRREGDAAITADPRRLKEALLNLVANAVEATPAGGEIDVRIEEGGGGVRIAVRDTGRGMPPEVLERVGTPFFTTRESGTGLGVSLARGVFAQHGGTLEYESAPGAGTVATATLPRTCQETKPDGARAAGR